MRVKKLLTSCSGDGGFSRLYARVLHGVSPVKRGKFKKYCFFCSNKEVFLFYM